MRATRSLRNWALPAFLGMALVGAAFSTWGAAPSSTGPVAPPETFTDEERAHWAYQVPARSEVPAVKERGWAKNPIDQFVLSSLEEMGFRHSPEADRIALIRRVTFDLTGLPPTPEEVRAFLDDPRADAYERLVDRLLASGQYGERWAQHWLDLAHYADTNGFEGDADRPDGWRYRDWVVNALNTDMPYDRFVALQLAGDEVAPGDPAGLIATGFNRCGPRELVGGNVDPEVRRQAELTEITGTVGSVFLGLTIACSRCHDHKFDALPTTDYYRLQAFFAATAMVESPIAPKAEVEAYEAAKKAVAVKIAPFQKEKHALEAPYYKVLSEERRAKLSAEERALMDIPAKKRTPAQQKLAEGLEAVLRVEWHEVAEAVARNPADHANRERLKREIFTLQSSLPRPPAHAQALVDQGKAAPETRVARRGDPKRPGPKVEPCPPGVVLAALPKGAFSADGIFPSSGTTGRRATLAQWLARPDNPLTARVIVNRLWQQHFGRGIVATPNDFGVRGEAPSHPELLDWLAAELVDQGWRLKSIHRLMVTSATYRQSSVVPAGKEANDDPDNTLCWRMNRRRLDAEGVRDAMLVASGDLNPRMAGPGVLVPIEKEVEDLIFTEAEVVDLWPETPDPAEHLRRSIYLYRKRNVHYPMFEAFDAPDTQTVCAERPVSTHSLQALSLLNSDFAATRAKALAGRLFREAPGGGDELIRRAYQVVLARDPSARETEQARGFLTKQTELVRLRQGQGEPIAAPATVPEGVGSADAAAVVDFALAMLNRNEFVYVP